jgi:concanavalin A-like lectin/glucanase superfamily protein/F5/8 type C domain-containing protein/FIMAH domain-containing protein
VERQPGRLRRGLVPVLVATLVTTTGQAASAQDGGVPPEVDPGTPTYAGLDDPVPDEPVAFDPAASMLQAVYDADLAAGGDSYWFDRLLERPFRNNQDDELYTRGRALYMYTHDPDELGFAGTGTGPNGGGGFAYREIIQTGVTDLYTVEVEGVPLDEDTAQRRQYPSHWRSVHVAPGLSVAQAKFITHENVAVTNLTLTNTGAAAAAYPLVASSPVVSTPAADGSELVDELQTRYDLTTVTARFSGDGFTAGGNALRRTVSLAPGESATVKVQLGAVTAELPGSAADYQRYRGLDPQAALRTQLAEYNRWWVDNVPYLDVPDQNIKKMSYYRTFLNRFNYIDANVPGNDFQYPVSIEGVLGYNNAIQLTQPMHMQDLKYFRDPLWSYGNWVSSGDGNQCTAFHDNPGSFSWGQSMEQFIAREGWESYQVHGGDEAIVESFARYAECDVEGQLAKFDSNDNFLVEYNGGLFTGNDADTPTFHWAQYLGLPTAQDRAESAYQYAGARAAAEAYAMLGEDAKADELNALAGNIRTAILELLWDDSPVVDPPVLQPVPATRSAGQDGFGNAVPLNASAPNQYVAMPAGILSGLTDATIAGWVNWNGGQTWSRVFDFGTGTGVNMFLTPNAGGAAGMRFAITTGGSGGEQQVTATQELPTGWQHVAVTLAGDTATIWLNGQPLVSETDVTLNPADLGNTDQNWIGRSQYADPLLAGTVDEFQIYDRALTQAELASLVDTPGGAAGGGNVARYSFEEQGDLAVALDSSGNGRHATVATAPQFVGDWPGQVFKHRLVANGEPVQWKDHQNFTPFIEGVVPTDDPAYREALRYYADAEEFPIMPFYTANQRDKQFATAVGVPGSNNFSNINSTLQAQLFAASLRQYPSAYITPGMYEALLEWLTWTQYVGGDNRYPDNNEFFFSWDPEDQTLGRSGIHHNILGAYNFMLIDDIAGVRPRLDDVLELWPIDVGWEYFTVNNLSYHGQDLTIVWNGDGHYAGVPRGYSAYLDGKRVFTLDRLAHLTWNSRNGEVTVLDGSGARASFRTRAELAGAGEVSLRDNPRIVEMFQHAGVDLSEATGWAVNDAEGRPVQASFSTTAPAARATAPQFAVDGSTMAGLPNQVGGYVAPNTIWGTEGSPNAEDWLEVALDQPRTVDEVRLYFFSDKDYEPRDKPDGDTYRAPSSYAVQYHDGSGWVDVPDQARSPGAPAPNLNRVEFTPVTTDRLRVLVTPTGDFGAGVEEIQVLDTTPTSFGEIRSLVDRFRDGGQVTQSGRLRLRVLLGVAELLLALHQPQGAALAMERFRTLAADQELVPGEQARHALTDEAEQLVAQHRLR